MALPCSAEAARPVLRRECLPTVPEQGARACHAFRIPAAEQVENSSRATGVVVLRIHPARNDLVCGREGRGNVRLLDGDLLRASQRHSCRFRQQRGHSSLLWPTLWSLSHFTKVACSPLRHDTAVCWSTNTARCRQRRLPSRKPALQNSCRASAADSAATVFQNVLRARRFRCRRGETEWLVLHRWLCAEFCDRCGSNIPGLGVCVGSCLPQCSCQPKARLQRGPAHMDALSCRVMPRCRNLCFATS